jgi:putative membrane protein
MNYYNPYSRFEGGQLILRDVLAADRTVLANERTFLAYMRTVLTLFVSGVTFIKFLGSVWLAVVGWLFILLAVFTFIYGTHRYHYMLKRLKQVHLVEPDDE